MLVKKVLLLRFLRICTTWSRRQLLSASTWRGTGRTRIPSLGWFLLRAGSTVLPVTTRRPRSFLLSGSSKCTLLPAYLNEKCVLFWCLILTYMFFFYLQRVYYCFYPCGLDHGQEHYCFFLLSYYELSFYASQYFVLSSDNDVLMISRNQCV